MKVTNYAWFYVSVTDGQESTCVSDCARDRARVLYLPDVSAVLATPRVTGMLKECTEL